MDESSTPRSYPAAKTTFQAPTLRVCAWTIHIYFGNFMSENSSLLVYSKPGYSTIATLRLSL